MVTLVGADCTSRLKPPTVYADNNAYFAKSDFEKLIRLQSEGHISLCVSDWNIYELARGKLEKGKEKLRRLECANPKYIECYIGTAVKELAVWVNRQFAGILTSTTPIHESYESYAKSEGMSAPGIPFSMEDFAELLSKRGMLESLQLRHDKAREELDQLRRHKRKLGAEPDKSEALAVINIVNMRLHEAKPFIHKSLLPALNKIKTELYVRWESILKFMPAAEVEHALSEFRIASTDRTATSNDSTDLMHLGTGVPYCDYFVSRDNYTARCVKHVNMLFPGKYAQHICTMAELEATVISAAA